MTRQFLIWAIEDFSFFQNVPYFVKMCLMGAKLKNKSDFLNPSKIWVIKDFFGFSKKCTDISLKMCHMGAEPKK